jgi:tetratricopeptide (TPR) repeat protein
VPFQDPDLVDRLMFGSVADVEAHVRQLDPDDREKLLAALRDRAAAYERDNASEELELVRFVLGVAEAGSNETTPQPALITTRDELDSAATRCSDPDEAIDLFQQYDELLTEEERALLREVTESRAEAKRLHAAGSLAEAATTLRRAAVLCLQLGLRFPAAALGLTVAEARSRLGRLRAALADARTSAEIADQAGLPELALRAWLFAADMLEDLDQGDAAAAEYDRVATQAAARQSRAVEFRARVGLAKSFHNRGRHLEAASVFRNALLSVAAWGAPDQMAALRNNLGDELLALGRAEQAAGEFQAALALRKGADFGNFGSVLSLFGLGDAKMLLGEREEAYEYWRQAYQLGFFSGDLDRLLTDFAGRVVAHGIDMSGRGVAVMGEIPDNTAGMLRIGLDSAIHGGAPARALLFASWLAHELASAGDVAESIALCRDMLTRYADVDKRSTVLQSLRMNYASLLLRQGTAGRQEALDVLWDSYTMIDGQMEETLLDERRGEFAAKWIGVIEELISLLLDHGETLAIPGGADPRLLAFGLHEAAKARGFLAALASVDVSAPAEVDQGLRHREAELIRQRRDLQTEADLTGSGKLFGRLQEVQAQLRDCWQEMQESVPAFVRLRRGIPSDIEDARRVLREHATRPMAIVSFFCAADHTRIFVLRSDDPEVGVVRSEVGRDALESVVLRLRHTFSGGKFPDPSPIRRTNPWRKSLGFFEELGEELLKFLPLVSGAELLCFVPHGPLHGLPLHALPDGDGGYLAERIGTVYAPSISSLSYVLSTKSSPAERAHTVYAAGVAAREDLHPDYVEHDDELFAGGRWDVLADSGPTVTKRHALRSSFGRRILHLTCHGYFNERSPLDSGLLLADGAERPSRRMDQVSLLEQARTILTAREVMSTSMGAEIVVLRACAGSVHAVRNAGDELDGLSRAFLYAGNSAAMAGLWNVDQLTSRDLLRAFYRHWSDPVRKPEKWQALQWAQQEFLRSAEEPYLRHPYHWAPFVLHGDWR